MSQCSEYVGLACVDGICPKANSDEYEKRDMPTVNSCNNCFYYKGCSDCVSNGTEQCPKK